MSGSRSSRLATVGLCFGCSVLSGPGQSYAVALYLGPLALALGASRVALATVFAVATLAAAATLPFVGRLADRWTARRYLSVTLGLMAIALLILSASSSLATVAAAFFLLRLLGQGALGVGTLTAVVRWFRAHRGRALAVVAAGYTAGEFLMPGVIGGLQGALGWRVSLVALGGFYLLLGVPVLLTFMREPTDFGREPCTGTRGADGHALMTLRDASRAPLLWGLAAAMTVTPLVLTGILLHQPAIFQSLGWGGAAVPAALRAYAAASLSSAYAAGWLCERVSSRWAIVTSLTALAGATGVAAFAGRGTGAVWVYAALLGAAAGTNSTANGLVWPEYFGTEALGSIKGLVSGLRNGATALGAMAVAIMGEGGGAYAVPLMACCGLAVLAAVIVAIALPASQPAAARHSPEDSGDRPRSLLARHTTADLDACSSAESRRDAIAPPDRRLVA